VVSIGTYTAVMAWRAAKTKGPEGAAPG
jgi:hypothetical protein